MKETPIPFTGEMVRAILEGCKTQTRRVIKPQPCEIGYWKETSEPVFSTRKWMQVNASIFAQECPYGVPGDRLWVKETWRLTNDEKHICYRADDWGEVEVAFDFKWKSGRFMPRKMSRITLEIVNVRVERVKEISEEDAKAEGIGDDWEPSGLLKFTKSFQYKRLWNSINAKRGYGWDVNPWVWVIEYKMLEVKG